MFGQQDQPVQRVLERAADRSVVGRAAPDHRVAAVHSVRELVRARRDRAFGGVGGRSRSRTQISCVSAAFAAAPSSAACSAVRLVDAARREPPRPTTRTGLAMVPPSPVPAIQAAKQPQLAWVRVAEGVQVPRVLEAPPRTGQSERVCASVQTYISHPHTRRSASAAQFGDTLLITLCNIRDLGLIASRSQIR